MTHSMYYKSFAIIAIVMISIMFYICLNAAHHDHIFFRLTYFHVSNSALFLHSTLVLSFYIDVVFKLSNGMHECSQ